MEKSKIICDIDGVLCENTRVPYLLKEPDFQNIQTINNLHKKGFNIILFTSRRNKYRKQTIKWLNMYKIKYHHLIMDKPKGDYYCDDKSIKLSDINKIGGKNGKQKIR